MSRTYTDRVALELPIRSDVEKTARSVIRAGAKSIPAWEELDRVDVRVVSCECLHAFLLADVPKLREGIACAGDEKVTIDRTDAQAHDISEVVRELVDLRSSLHVP